MIGGGTLGSGGAIGATFLGGIAGCNGAEQEAEPVLGVIDEEEGAVT